MDRAKDRRVQALFSSEEFELLADHAARTGKSISSVVREAVEEHLIKELRRRQRVEAAQWLCSGGDDLPMKDWPEEDILKAAELSLHYPQLPGRNLLHVAVMLRNGLSEILSVDSHFDAVTQVRRLDPASFASST